MEYRTMMVVWLLGLCLAGPGLASAHRVTLLDDCDPTDPNWAPTGGCLLKEGDVTLEEFNAELRSLLADAVIGHQAWRFDPAYLDLEASETLRVKNKGGRLHTFTEVADFGGGGVFLIQISTSACAPLQSASSRAPRMSHQERP